MLKRLRILAALLAGLMLIPAAGAQAPERGTGPSGLPLPRFVSLDTDRANMRTGPGRRYPIMWVYMRRGLPLEITAEYGQWRRVRDSEGVEGWMHLSLLSGRRTILITGGDAVLRAGPHPDAPPAILAAKGAQGLLKGCRGDWCRIQMQDHEGWLQRNLFWGSYPDETAD